MFIFLPDNTTPESVTAGAPNFQLFVPATQVPVLAVEHEDFPGSGFQQLYLRMSINDGSTSIPTVEIDAGSGAFVTIPSVGSAPIETGATDVGTASFVTRTATELLILFFLTNDVGDFDLSIRITDTSGGTHRYVSVVGGLADETQEPWIHVDSSQGDPATWNNGKRLLLGEEAELEVVIENLGTGPLILDEPADPLNGTFSVLNIMSLDRELAARESVTWNVEVTAGADAGQDSFTWQLASDDTKASAGTGHNAELELAASWGKLEVVFVLDASGSMNMAYDGSTATVDNPKRWQELYNAVGSFFSVLQTIALEGAGQVSILMYPDRTQNPTAAESIFMHVDREDVTESIFADMVDQPLGGSALQFNDAVQSGAGRTAITYALSQGTGTTEGTYGRFDDGVDARIYNHRFVVLMTDGLNNEGPDLEEYYDSGAYGDWLVDKRINFLAIPYGPDEDDTGVARAELATIAQDQTDEDQGIYGAMLDPTDTDGELLGAEMLRNAFQKALATSLNLDFDADPVVVLSTTNPLLVRTVSLTEYDRQVTFAIGWQAQLRQHERQRYPSISLIRPDGHIYTLKDLLKLEHVRIANAADNMAITLTSEFLGDRHDLTNVNMGDWKLRVNYSGESPLRITYHVLLKSALRLRLNYESGRAWAGENLDVEANLSLFGRPLTGASVRLEVRTPDNSAINWLAAQPMGHEVQATFAEILKSGGDVNGLTAKKTALAQHGVTFTASSSNNTIVMHDTNGDGVYRATIPNTAIQGKYELYATATSLTAKGQSFRRERSAGVRLVPRPDPNFSIFGIDYATLQGGQIEALVTYKPLDAAGNVILFDPAHGQRVDFQVDGATWVGPMHTEWDGVYTQTMRFPEGHRPNLDVIVDGEIVTLDLPIPSINDLAWVCQAVLTPGREAKRNANRHADPNAAEGNPFEGRRDFVSLGGGGCLFTLPDRLCRHMRSITVVVEPDADLRSYKLEILTIRGFKRPWIEVGRSRGVTQTFDLGELRRRHVFGIRVTDLSRRTRNPDMSPSSTPGVSIRGVGFEPGRRRW